MRHSSEAEKKRKKKEQDFIETFIFDCIQKSMKTAIDAAMKDIFKDFKL